MTALFVEVPHASISWIYASIGCQHTLQPSKDDYTPPSIPSLTIRGFVRWQSIELLLGPEEHVPFIQNAVRNFNIKHLDTGEPFPLELPKDAFPLKADPDIERWHNQCAERLRERAATGEESEGPGPPLPPRPKVEATYAHVRRSMPSPQLSPRTGRPLSIPRDYFQSETRPSRPIAYSHVSGVRIDHRTGFSRDAGSSRNQRTGPPTPEERYDPRVARARRRSFPENLTDSPDGSASSSLKVPDGRHHTRRHSQPRLVVRHSDDEEMSSTDASTSSDEERGGRKLSPAGPGKPKKGKTISVRTSSYEDEPMFKPGPRYGRKESMPGTPTSPTTQFLRERDRDNEDGSRRGYALEIDLNGNLSAPFRPKKSSNMNATVPSPSLERRRVPRRNSMGKGGVRWKDLSGLGGIFGKNREAEMEKEDEENDGPGSDRRRSSHSADRGGDSAGRERRRKERDREREREREKDYRDDGMPRPQDARRTSSHDADRYSSRRERERDRDSDRDGRSLRERDRDRERDRTRRSPIRGVDGRPYPATPVEPYR